MYGAGLIQHMAVMEDMRTMAQAITRSLDGGYRRKHIWTTLHHFDNNIQLFVIVSLIAGIFTIMLDEYIGLIPPSIERILNLLGLISILIFDLIFSFYY